MGLYFKKNFKYSQPKVSRSYQDYDKIERFEHALEQYHVKLKPITTKYRGIEEYGFDIVKYTNSVLDEMTAKLKSELISLKQKHSEEYWEKLDDFKFEEEVGRWFKNKGYAVTVTRKSGDGGIDLIVSKAGERSYVQCKHYAKSTSLGVSVARELLGVMASDGVKKGYIACLFPPSSECRAFAAKNNITILQIRDFTTRCEQASVNSVSVYYRGWINIGDLSQYQNIFESDGNVYFGKNFLKQKMRTLLLANSSNQPSVMLSA